MERALLGMLWNLMNYTNLQYNNENSHTFMPLCMISLRFFVYLIIQSLYYPPAKMNEYHLKKRTISKKKSFNQHFQGILLMERIRLTSCGWWFIPPICQVLYMQPVVGWDVRTINSIKIVSIGKKKLKWIVLYQIHQVWKWKKNSSISVKQLRLVVYPCLSPLFTKVLYIQPVENLLPFRWLPVDRSMATSTASSRKSKTHKVAFFFQYVETVYFVKRAGYL